MRSRRIHRPGKLGRITELQMPTMLSHNCPAFLVFEVGAASVSFSPRHSRQGSCEGDSPYGPHGFLVFLQINPQDTSFDMG